MENTFMELESHAKIAGTNRYVAGLRGDTRQRLDHLLLHELMGTGIGRSAFILAAIDVVKNMTESEFDSFIKNAKRYESELPN